MQDFPTLHGGQLDPPQSTSVSVPLLTWSVQLLPPDDVDELDTLEVVTETLVVPLAMLLEEDVLPPVPGTLILVSQAVAPILKANTAPTQIGPFILKVIVALLHVQPSPLPKLSVAASVEISERAGTQLRGSTRLAP